MSRFKKKYKVSTPVNIDKVRKKLDDDTDFDNRNIDGMIAIEKLAEISQSESFSATQTAQNAKIESSQALQNASSALQFTTGKYLPPVQLPSQLTSTYPDADENDKVYVRDNGKVYSLQNGSWTEIMEVDVTPLTEIDSRLSEQIEAMRQEADITVTVGTIGDYATINEAIEYLSKKRMPHKRENLKAEIKLLTGFVMEEQVITEGLNLGWIAIVSEDAEVTIDRASLNTRLEFPSYAGSSALIGASSAFIAYNNGISPVIRTLFRMNRTGSGGDRGGFFAINGAQIFIDKDCGCIDASGHGIYAAQSSVIAAMGANVEGATANALAVFRGSWVSFRGGRGDGAGSYGIYADSNSQIEASGCFLNNIGLTALWADSSSIIAAPDSFLDNAGANGVMATAGSIIDANYCSIDNAEQRGVYANDGGKATVSQSSIKNAGNVGVETNNNGEVNAVNADASGAINRGMMASNGGKINARGANGRRGSTNGSNDFRVSNGGTIIAHDAIGGTSQRLNMPTSLGIIYGPDTPDQGTASLQNGWSGTLTYTRHANGIIHLKGTLTVGTATRNTIITTGVPSGYRPQLDNPFLVYSSNVVLSGFNISPSGAVAVRVDGLTEGQTIVINTLYQS